MKAPELTDDVINAAVAIVEAAEQVAAANGITVSAAARIMLQTMRFAQTFSAFVTSDTSKEATH